MNPFNSKYKITQAFGVNAADYKKFGLKGHEGIDLIPTGTVLDVFCLADGVVVLDDDEVDSVASDPYGKIVTIWHPTLKLATMYCHLASNTVAKGQQVKKGDKIGVMGSTGNSTGPHLHLNLFQVDDNGVRLNRDNGYNGGIDPLPFLSSDDVPSVDLQAELDKVRKERDDNWNAKLLVEKDRDDAFKKLQDLTNDYEGVKQELTSYKSIIRTYADMLGTSPTETEKMSGEIKRLIGIEDQYNSVSKQNENFLSEIATLQKTEGDNKLEIANLIQERNDSRQALDSCLKQKVNKELKDYTVLERLLSIFM